ncbi:MBL fold metallo-hydrolase [Tautonia plasticadhaerens]|uniref:Ribonuclease Z n=1 Tax=Tautonia plasticadhaerens TaxID=2527974 RepID=A0A518GUZ5_9BACT|nr:MBL fold metallo-hydrolase [Tautonia plasticadhaerens]QDV32412.1 Ribonuclease Z [Tautonia plasticadhaerens]
MPDAPLPRRTATEFHLVNGSTGDPLLFVDYPGRDDALLFDAGENGRLPASRLSDLAAVFLTHHHVDHLVGFDRVLRANLDRDKDLRVVGPEGTIDRITARVRTYEYPFFPFQKLRLHLLELGADRLRSAVLDWGAGLPPAEAAERPVDPADLTPTVFENDLLRVEAARVDHTVPCLSFAIVEAPGYHVDGPSLRGGPLRPGPWVSRAMTLLRSGAPGETPVEVDGGIFPLARLRDRYFRKGRGGRIAYVVDTLWSDASRPALLRLCRRATRLYCDSFYAGADLKKARTHKHMTAPQAAELARDAGADHLTLIHVSSRYAGRLDALVAEAAATFPDVTAEDPEGGPLPPSPSPRPRARRGGSPPGEASPA